MANPFRRLALLGERVMRWFPERQIYVRSDRRIQFYTVSPSLQGLVAGLVAVFLAWVAFSTVTVVFKDRIIAAEDHRFQRAQDAFEDRLVNLQMSYDDLVATATSAKIYADQKVRILSQHQQALVQSSHVGYPVATSRKMERPAGDPVRKSAGPAQFLDRAIGWLVLRRKRPSPPVYHPSLHRLAGDIAHLRHLSESANVIMGAIENGTLRDADAQKQVIAATGINADLFLRRLRSVNGEGGPEIPLDTIELAGIADRTFTQAYFRAEANLDELSSLRQAVLRLPVAAPLGSTMMRTSGFGPRLDPFSGRYAFHPGVDFAGPTGTAVLATAAGLVTFAGRDGGYGNMVEIDHGYGLKTRYAHLLKVNVEKGQRIAKGAIVGRLGSTGRSTGPHVHYEVWYDDRVRNPDGFLHVGALTNKEVCGVIACSTRRR